MNDDLETMRHAAIMETVEVMQRAADLFMAVHKHAHDCAVLAHRMAAEVYDMKDAQA